MVVYAKVSESINQDAGRRKDKTENLISTAEKGREKFKESERSRQARSRRKSEESGGLNYGPFFKVREGSRTILRMSEEEVPYMLSPYTSEGGEQGKRS